MRDYHTHRNLLIEKIDKVTIDSFDEVALDLFRFQISHNSVYNNYVKSLCIDPVTINNIVDIPFLPISAYKHHKVRTGEWQAEVEFTSSATTGKVSSQHAVHDLKWYERHSSRTFEKMYGPLKDYKIYALLPSYLERSGSSLVYMVQHFMRLSGGGEDGFFLYNHEQLYNALQNDELDLKPMLIGVSFALLDFAEKYVLDLPELIIMETGGMKGRKEEMHRDELHKTLTKQLGVNKIHSEYGMTELLSQAYSKGDGIFSCSTMMKVLSHQLNDPLSIEQDSATGRLSIIDLANIDTCSFLATEDIGRVYLDGTFEVLGRLDHSETRGCNLMVSDIL